MIAVGVLRDIEKKMRSAVRRIVVGTPVGIGEDAVRRGDRHELRHSISASPTALYRLCIGLADGSRGYRRAGTQNGHLDASVPAVHGTRLAHVCTRVYIHVYTHASLVAVIGMGTCIDRRALPFASRPFACVLGKLFRGGPTASAEGQIEPGGSVGKVSGETRL